MTTTIPWLLPSYNVTGAWSPEAPKICSWETKILSKELARAT